MIGRADLERDLVIVACAISAGIHAALTPTHLADGAAAGTGFAASAAALAGLAVALTRRPGVSALGGAAAVMTALLAGYALAATTGLPVLHPEPEAVDTLAVFTKALELAGLLAAAHLLSDSVPSRSSRPKGTLA